MYTAPCTLATYNARTQPSSSRPYLPAKACFAAAQLLICLLLSRCICKGFACLPGAPESLPKRASRIGELATPQDIARGHYVFVQMLVQAALNVQSVGTKAHARTDYRGIVGLGILRTAWCSLTCLENGYIQAIGEPMFPEEEGEQKT